MSARASMSGDPQRFHAGFRCSVRKREGVVRARWLEGAGGPRNVLIEFLDGCYPKMQVVHFKTVSPSLGEPLF